MSQTTYSYTSGQPLEGCLGSTRNQVIYPKRNNSGSDIPFGRFVVHDSGTGTSEMAIKLPSASGDMIVGVLVHSHAHNPSNTTGLLDDDIGNVLVEGDVWMIAEEALTVDDPVYIRYDASGATGSQALGRVRDDADSSKAVLAANCRFMTTATTAGDSILVRVNLP